MVDSTPLFFMPFTRPQFLDRLENSSIEELAPSSKNQLRQLPRQGKWSGFNTRQSEWAGTSSPFSPEQTPKKASQADTSRQKELHPDEHTHRDRGAEEFETLVRELPASLTEPQPVQENRSDRRAPRHPRSGSQAYDPSAQGQREPW
ncbi:MAG: hypothetical protein EAZ84_12465 [Verrucomicrobia bacterium]|nr:MAG: hypothetical protein EAZ84_12465 [Verrucomicrobiota bacterium]TAF23230.1 MAG: hypothetical protein EAZ71_13110 [Verrucomicrobiota bacterium]